eukprot:2690422-Lingulodinium_polyedra.AAC.1
MTDAATRCAACRPSRHRDSGTSCAQASTSTRPPPPGPATGASSSGGVVARGGAARTVGPVSWRVPCAACRPSV